VPPICPTRCVQTSTRAQYHLALTWTDAIEAQGETPRPDTSQDCSLVGRLSIVADLLIAGSVDVRVARAGPGERGRSTGGDVGVAVLPVVS